MTDNGIEQGIQSDFEVLTARAVTNPTTNSPGYSELRRGLISLLLGMGSYYGARYLGAPALDALLISTVVSALRVGYAALRARRFDPIAPSCWPPTASPSA